ncbi:hypothetical protein [Parachlamydia acanthamoebae]|uniref:hypothetical protein n=1 Tax=Parachlamydia acanthamoebae TaxID=83552 RepID=UPI00187288AB|nr:hypothetical protein [Parachlamydia acanthamoebae]
MVHIYTAVPGHVGHVGHGQVTKKIAKGYRRSKLEKNSPFKSGKKFFIQAPIMAKEL